MGEIIMYHPDVLLDLSFSVASRLKGMVYSDLNSGLEKEWVVLRFEEVEDKVFNMHYRDE